MGDYSALKGNEILIHVIISVEPWRRYSKWKKPCNKEQILYDSTYEVPRIVKLIDIESKGVVPKDWLRGVGKCEFTI